MNSLNSNIVFSTIHWWSTHSEFNKRWGNTTNSLKTILNPKSFRSSFLFLCSLATLTSLLSAIEQNLRDLVPFVQFRKREKHPWRSVTFYCNFTKSNTHRWVFFTFFKLYKWYQIMQRITYSFAAQKIPSLALVLKSM